MARSYGEIIRLLARLQIPNDNLVFSRMLFKKIGNSRRDCVIAANTHTLTQGVIHERSPGLRRPKFLFSPTSKTTPTWPKKSETSAWTKSKSAKFTPIFRDPDSWQEIVKTYADAGVSVISIGVQTFTGDPSEKSFFECAALAGAKHISCHFQLESYPQSHHTGARLEPGIRAFAVGIHCHGGYHFGGQPGVLKHLIGLGRARNRPVYRHGLGLANWPSPGQPRQMDDRFRRADLRRPLQRFRL